MINPLLVVSVVLDSRYKPEYLRFAYGELFDEKGFNGIITKVKKVLEHLYDW